MQFKVPQFLDIEDKIFGPFTFRQFVYLVGGAGLCFVIYRLIGLLWGLIPIIGIGVFVWALTFYRPNNKPFVNMLESWFKYMTQSKLYIWKRRRAKNIKPDQTLLDMQGINMEGGASTPRLSTSKLRDLAWSLDVLELNREKKGINNV